jgi:hypothetical protein
MMDTAMKVIARGSVDIAEDLAHAALSELSERVTDSELLQRRPRRRKRTIMRPRTLFVAAVVVGTGVAVVAVAAAVKRRRSMIVVDEVVPDPFGVAVEEERAAGVLGAPAPS